MTNEEMENITKEKAIKELKDFQTDIGSSYDDLDNSSLYYALDTAIKALEQQEQHEADLQGAYDCGYNCGYADAMNDIAESEDEDKEWD